MVMDFEEVLKLRRSNRKFTDEQVEKAELDGILFAGNCAPIGSNLFRDLHLTVVQDKKTLHALNIAFAKRLQDREAVKIITGAMEKQPGMPWQFAVLRRADRHNRVAPQPGTAAGIEYANTACVAMTMHLAAVNLGLGSVLAWGVFEAMRIYPELDNSSMLRLPAGLFLS